ncbi:MAG: hypothetical protein ACTSQ9_01735 [Candidatus Hodarchaeales archaeon]
MDNCEKLVEEAGTATRHSLDMAAGIYQEASKCFDKEGNRIKAGQYLTIAGDFYLELQKMNKAASCYGKAIVRHLMADDIDTAKILVNKGLKYGFTSSTYQFKLALNALERKTDSSEIDINAKEEKVSDKEFEIDSLPEIDIVPLDEDETLIPIEIDSLVENKEVEINRNDFFVPQLDTHDPSKMSSFAVLAAVSDSARKKTEKNIISEAVVKDLEGETKFISPTFKISPKKNITAVNESNDQIIEKLPHKESELAELEHKPILEDPDILEVEYSARTEIINEYEEDLVDIEIIDTIPHQWQVVDIQTEFDLGEKKRTAKGMMFTWNAEKLVPGKKASIEYILRKRVERSIIIRKENQVTVLNLYHSVRKDLNAHLDFVNTSGQIFQEILIEDVIPPELIVIEVKSPQKFRPVTIPTHDSTLFRWIFSNLPPGDNFTIDYGFKEKPLTRTYHNEIETDEGTIILEKTSLPIIDSLQYEYIWLYTVDNPTPHEIAITDCIPLDFEILLTEPIHISPNTNKEKTLTRLTWDLEGETRCYFILRMVGKESFTTLSPEVRISGMSDIQLMESTSDSERKLIDLQRLKNSFSEEM